MNRFDPLRRVGLPALLGVVVAVVSLAGGRHLWVIGIVPGVIFSVLGVRIAYDARLTSGAERIRAATPWNGLVPLWWFRQWAGAMIAIFGLFFLGLGAEGIAKLVS